MTKLNVIFIRLFTFPFLGIFQSFFSTVRTLFALKLRNKFENKKFHDIHNSKFDFHIINDFLKI